MIFPITFSIPNDKIVVEIPLKTKFLSNLVPRRSNNLYI